MPKTLAVLDLKKALLIVSDNRKLADDLLSMLIKSLPDYKLDIKKYAQYGIENNRDELKHTIHKIHGGLRYIGAPALSEIISASDEKLSELNEKQLKQHIELIFYEFDRLTKEKKYSE